MSDYVEMKQYIERRLARGLDAPELDGAEVLALIHEVERLRTAEVDALRKDQERINFIEKEWFYAGGGNRYAFSFNSAWETPGQDLRDAIDLEMAKEQKI